MPFNFPLAPPAASSFAGQYDALFYTLCVVSLLFTLLVFAGIIFFTVRYRQGSRADRSRPVYEDARIEFTLLGVPTILGLVFFWFGANQYIQLRTPPKDAQDIFVVGKQWMWHVQHPNGVRENNTLHVPIGRDIRLTMISQDVIHAFYIPAFRTQMMVVPGRYTTMWFRPTQAGEYHLFCNMYCGTQHSEMGGKVVVMEPREYAEWLANGGESTSNLTMAQRGARLYAGRLACTNCHGGTDNPRGPALAGLLGRRREFSNAPAQVADEEYIRESILRPYNKIVKGYGQEMPSYEKAGPSSPGVSEEEILELIAYIKSMGGEATAPATEGGLNLRPLAVTPNAGPAANVMSAGRPNEAATPTGHGKNLSVNAMAAEEGQQ